MRIRQVRAKTRLNKPIKEYSKCTLHINQDMCSSKNILHDFYTSSTQCAKQGPHMAKPVDVAPDFIIFVEHLKGFQS